LRAQSQCPIKLGTIQTVAPARLEIDSRSTAPMHLDMTYAQVSDAWYSPCTFASISLDCRFKSLTSHYRIAALTSGLAPATSLTINTLLPKDDPGGRPLRDAVHHMRTRIGFPSPGLHPTGSNCVVTTYRVVHGHTGRPLFTSIHRLGGAWTLKLPDVYNAPDALSSLSSILIPVEPLPDFQPTLPALSQFPSYRFDPTPAPHHPQ
jgi:hypothetical protein